MDKLFNAVELRKKIEQFRANANVDLSTEEDLSIAVMNLISLEEHFFFSAEKSGNRHYFELLDRVRQLRTELMQQMINRHEGETWCACKHLLAATMRLTEVGTKRLRAGDQTGAHQVFDQAYALYNMFWVLRLQLASAADVTASVTDAAKHSSWTQDDIVKKLVDCCYEGQTDARDVY